VRGPDQSGSGKTQVAGYCEHGNEHRVPLYTGNFVTSWGGGGRFQSPDFFLSLVHSHFRFKRVQHKCDTLLG
jgi:hypothetical protein